MIYYGDDWSSLFEDITGYGLGRSLVALFGRVSRGIYTKGTVVGVGFGFANNVGDIVGMGSDLSGSYAESSCAALVVASISSFRKQVQDVTIGIIGFVTEYYTSNAYDPVQEVADSCNTGATTNFIFGIALGYKFIILPSFSIAISSYVSFRFAAKYSVAIATLGMLSTIATGLAIDVYGPISDNVSGIAKIVGMPYTIRERTDALDTAGNTTATIGKGFAIDSTTLVSLALFGAFTRKVAISTVDGLNPKVFIGLLVGAMFPYWFSAMTMKNVGKTTLKIVEEVCKQFNTIPDLIDDADAKPDYARIVKICIVASIKEIILPGSCAYQAVVIGDLLKDASVPSLNIPIKLMAVESLVFTPFFTSQGDLIFKI
ncbi:hypothetical protein K1719_028102 [Acacia pycnantha]|nr:hypothetical protein K1719_028102 [Acacia pycnantha]